jgi:hypothetical protein
MRRRDRRRKSTDGEPPVPSGKIWSFAAQERSRRVSLLFSQPLDCHSLSGRMSRLVQACSILGRGFHHQFWARGSSWLAAKRAVVSKWTPYLIGAGGRISPRLKYSPWIRTTVWPHPALAPLRRRWSKVPRAALKRANATGRPARLRFTADMTPKRPDLDRA